MTEATKIINWAEIEVAKLFKELPVVVKQYGNEALQVCNSIKTAMASPEAAVIETALEQMIPGAAIWVPTVATTISKALGIAIPLITEVEANANESVTDQALALVKYLQGLSPKMRNAGLLKLLSGIFQGIDPTLTEVEADTAAQTVYAVSVK